MAFACGLAVALAGAVWFAASPGAALPGPDESTFVPVVPCRLMDTRPAPEHNVGPRTTPLGPGETYELQVTGAVGDCSLPTEATAVALNVTAVDPTAASYLTLFPAGAQRPTVSNVNFTAGAAPTPNKAIVRLSDGGELGIFNAFGDVHVVADATGYYTTDGLDSLVAALATKANLSDVYTRAELDAALAGKANTADVYTKSDIDAALAAKANAADVYTRSEIDARTQMRTISVPPQSLLIPDPTSSFSIEDGELWWNYDASDSATIRLARPADWTGDSPVTVRVMYTRTPNDGTVRLRVFARGFDPGSSTNTLATSTDFSTQTEQGMNVVREVSAAIAPVHLDAAWWDLELNRADNLPGTDYQEPLFVRSIALEYEAYT